MRQSFILFFLLCLTALTGYSQDDPRPDGYKLKTSRNIIYVYRNLNGKPDFSVRNQWNNRYWFKVDDTKSYEDTTTKEKYIRITIPSTRRFDDKGLAGSEKGYNTTVNWKDEEFIDGSDFNTWLWIRLKDFDSLKFNYYRNVQGDFVLSALVVPFKFRPKTASQSNSVINGDINLGTFVGWRFNKGENFGMSIGGHLGISSISLNASNNTSITDSSTETIQGFTYGYGIIFDIKKQFQIGLVGGYDYAIGNLAKTYVYQNKTWFSFSLNFKFLDFGKKDAADTNKNEGEKAKKAK